MTRDSIRRRVAAATPGEWVSRFHVVYSHGGSIGEMDATPDAHLTAHARQDLPLLLAVTDAAAALVWNATRYPSEKVDLRDLQTALAALEAAP